MYEWAVISLQRVSSSIGIAKIVMNDSKQSGVLKHTTRVSRGTYPQKKTNMSKKLLIVESPAKAKTIEKILGKDFTVKSSFGHIRDLEKGNSAIDVKHNFHPHYVVSPEKLKVVKELKEQAKKVDGSLARDG